MSACRETNNIWYYAKNKMWKSVYDSFTGAYFWHDSFGHYIYRWILCPLFGHKYVRDVSDPGEPVRLYCFNCERDV